MARTDAVQFFLELAAEWRRLGATVTFEPGWERRGNGTSPAYEGGVVHHTGFVSSFANPLPARNTLLNGRPDLPGPLCNVAGPVCPADAPQLHIVAAFPANHAGASGGKSMGPLPKSSLFNRLVVGLEVDYAGVTPMHGGQYRAALIFARGLANVLARSVEYVRAHAETSITGKWDIGVGNGRVQTADMGAFRRDAANLTPLSAQPALPLGDDDMDMRTVIDNTQTIWVATSFTLRNAGTADNAALLDRFSGAPRLALTQGEVGKLRAQIEANRAAMGLDFDEAAVGKAVLEGLLPSLIPAVTEALAAKLPAAGATGITREDVEQAVRDVFADAAA